MIEILRATAIFWAGCWFGAFLLIAAVWAFWVHRGDEDE